MHRSIFGPHTFAGVVAYREARSAGQYYALSAPLAVDGVVGPETWARLAPDRDRPPRASARLQHPGVLGR